MLLSKLICLRGSNFCIRVLWKYAGAYAIDEKSSKEKKKKEYEFFRILLETLTFTAPIKALLENLANLKKYIHINK